MSYKSLLKLHIISYINQSEYVAQVFISTVVLSIKVMLKWSRTSVKESIKFGYQNIKTSNSADN